MYIHMYMYTCIHVYIYTHIYIHVYIYVYKYIHVYIYIHIYRYAHTHTHTHTHTQNTLTGVASWTQFGDECPEPEGVFSSTKSSDPDMADVAVAHADPMPGGVIE